MTFRIRFTEEAGVDLVRLYRFQAERDPGSAGSALTSIKEAIHALETSPFIGRKGIPDDPMIRELLISYGASGYIALYEIEPGQIVTILAVRHQLEDDYH